MVLSVKHLKILFVSHAFEVAEVAKVAIAGYKQIQSTCCKFAKLKCS